MANESTKSAKVNGQLSVEEVSECNWLWYTEKV